ncbi:hypothetical protein QTP88_001005 [Uroleucon formosanum]
MPDQEEKLIEEVRNNPELYDLSKPSHKDIILKDDIWKNISLKVGRSDEDVSVGTDDEIDVDDSNKDDNVELPTCSFAGNRVRSKSDKLAAILAKKTEDRNIIIQSFQRQNEQLLNANKNQEDDTDLFYKSIAITVKKLPTKGINEAKRFNKTYKIKT